MRQLTLAVQSEWLKIKSSRIVLNTFIAFSLGPIMTGILLFIVKNANQFDSSVLSKKAEMMSLTVDWESYLSILSQVVGVGGILVFGFICSWMFGREFTEKTSKDLLALPTSRSTIINAKFTVYAMWCVLLALSNLLLGLLVGMAIGLENVALALLSKELVKYGLVTLMVIALGPPLAFLALYKKGYLAPLGFLILTLVISQILGALGLGIYFPWSVPGLYSGIGGIANLTIPWWSVLNIVLAMAFGFGFSHYVLNKKDQHI